MLLSIITINYNDSNGIKKTMKSVECQTWKAFEHIIIDGASTDNSLKVIKSFSYPNINYISEPDTGIYNAMNKGIKKANGKYLLFLNSGDILLKKESLETIAQYLRGESSFVGCNLVLDYPSGTEEKTHPEKISFSYLISKTIYHPSTFIKREMFNLYGLYNEGNSIVSDWEFFFKTIGLNGESFARVPIPLTLFDMTGISSNSKHKNKVKEEKEHVFNHYLKSFKNSELDAYCFEQLKNPSSRTKLLVKIENHKSLRKITTVFLKIISKFI